MIGGAVGKKHDISGTQNWRLPGYMIPNGTGKPQNQPVGIPGMDSGGVGNALDDADEFQIVYIFKHIITHSIVAFQKYFYKGSYKYSIYLYDLRFRARRKQPQSVL